MVGITSGHKVNGTLVKLSHFCRCKMSVREKSNGFNPSQLNNYVSGQWVCAELYNTILINVSRLYITRTY